MSPRAKDRLCHPRQAPKPCRSQQQRARPWGQQLPPPITVHDTFLPSWLPPQPHLINSISLPPLSFHLVSSTSPAAPSPCALAAAPSCCAGWEIPSCSPWDGFGWVLWGALHPWQAPASPWGWQSPNLSIQPTPAAHAGGELPCGGQKEGAGCGCCLLGGAGTTSPMPRHVPPAGCPEGPVPRAGETPDFGSSQPPAWKPSCLLLHIIPAQKRALLCPFLLWGARLLRLQGKYPKTSHLAVSQVSKGATPGLAAEEHTKMANLEAWVFYKPES